MEDHHKFRLVYVFDKEITSYKDALKIQLTLMKLFPEADESCKNINRFYFAGREIVYQSDNIIHVDNFTLNYDDQAYNKTINNLISLMRKDGISEFSDICTNLPTSTVQILSDIQDSTISPNISTGKVAVDYYNIKAIANRDVQYLKTKLQHPMKIFDNDGEFWYYIYHHLDIATLLDIQNSSSFRCIFHDDASPSANIFQNADGVYLYHCCSSSCKITLNIKQIVEKLGCYKSEYKAIKFLKDIYNLSIRETDWSIEQKANLDGIIRNLDLGYFTSMCPKTDENMAHVKDLFRLLLAVARDNIYGENYTNSDGDVVFFVSLSELCRQMKISEFRTTSISQKIALLVYHDLLRKLDDSKIPEAMLKKAQAIAIEKGYQKRVNFYAIPSWVFDQLTAIERNGVKWQCHNYTITGTCYEMFFRGDGVDVAQNIYPQHKKTKITKVDNNTGEIIEHIQDRTVSSKSKRKTKEILKVINQCIAEKMYVTEKEVRDSLYGVYTAKSVDVQLKIIRADLGSYGLKRVKATPELRKKYNIKIKGNVYVIMKE